jgi:hypothetical protein
MLVIRRNVLATLWMTCVAGIVAAQQPQETRADVVRMEETKVGVTRPAHAYVAPGGPISEMAWKALPASAVRNGYRESYKAEIAAYEMDKLLMLNMVPPKVERRVKATTESPSCGRRQREASRKWEASYATGAVSAAVEPAND